MSHSRYPAQSNQNSLQYRPNAYRPQSQQQRKSQAYNAPNIVQPVQQYFPHYSNNNHNNINNNSQIHSNQRQKKYRRQTSELSYYPDTKWCAIYLNKSVNGAQAMDMDGMDADVRSKIERTNTYLKMDLEENIILEIQMNMDEDEEHNRQIMKRKQDKEQEKDQMIDTFMSVTSTTDRKSALLTLKENGWNLEMAASAAFSSNNVLVSNSPPPGTAYANNNSYQQPVKVQKSTIRMLLPDGRQFSYQMDASDTFWGVYGRILQSVPDLGNKAFTFELKNGHVLSENEFDQTLLQVNLVPYGDILIKY